VKITYDPAYDTPDERRDYGEPHIKTIGLLADRLVTVIWTPRDGARRVISMRCANDREKASYRQRLGEG